MSLLSYILLVPVITLGILLLLPASAARAIRWLCALSGLVACALSLELFFAYNSATGSIQFEEIIPWVQGVGISYLLLFGGGAAQVHHLAIGH